MGIMLEKIKKHTKNSLEIIYKDETKSTNADAREIAIKEGRHNVLVVSSYQTNGRGRMGRAFHSPKGTGIYFSVILKPSIPVEKSYLITTSAAVAVSDTLDEIFGVETKIKWVNDVYYNGKKVCGVLTESVNNFDYVVLGVGINVAYPEGGFPDDIKDIAGAMCEKADEKLLGEIVGRILKKILYYSQRLEDKEFYSTYINKNYLMDRIITVPNKGKGKVVGIDEDFKLVVEYENKTIDYLVSGEVSLHDTCR